jgi:hypothetical protein
MEIEKEYKDGEGSTRREQDWGRRGGQIRGEIG